MTIKQALTLAAKFAACRLGNSAFHFEAGSVRAATSRGVRGQPSSAPGQWMAYS